MKKASKPIRCWIVVDSQLGPIQFQGADCIERFEVFTTRRKAAYFLERRELGKLFSIHRATLTLDAEKGRK